MYWAAGMSYASISEVPVNPFPAQVLNLSVGGRAPCSQTEQDAVTAIVQDGHVVVAAAGNDGGPMDAPANCVGTLSVAGIRHLGTKVGYSNVSSTAATVSIAAPAGNAYRQPQLP
jgi:serine protease